MKRLNVLTAVLAAIALAACGGGDDDDGGGGGGFTQPAGTVPVNFTVDDTANKLFAAGDLKWKGSMTYDEATRKITYDSAWSGGTGLQWAPLYDDGPWNQGNPAGHEPIGAVAGDNKWGVTVFATPPATGTETYSYGLIDVDYETAYGNGWIWPPGDNGSFTVTAGNTNAITAQGLVIPAHGTIDLRLILDTAALNSETTWDTSTVGVKGSAWAWGTVTLADDGTKGDATPGDGKFTFQLSQYTGVGKPFNHSGLLKSGDQPAFVFVLGGTEYRLAGVPDHTGATAAVKPAAAATWTDVAITNQPAGDKNNIITVP